VIEFACKDVHLVDRSTVGKVIGFAAQRGCENGARQSVLPTAPSPGGGQLSAPARRPPRFMPPAPFTRPSPPPITKWRMPGPVFSPPSMPRSVSSSQCGRRLRNKPMSVTGPQSNPPVWLVSSVWVQWPRSSRTGLFGRPRRARDFPKLAELWLPHRPVAKQVGMSAQLSMSAAPPFCGHASLRLFRARFRLIPGRPRHGMPGPCADGRTTCEGWARSWWRVGGRGEPRRRDQRDPGERCRGPLR